MTQICMASISETGARTRNEDDLRHGVARNGHYAVLADGAGGHLRGAEAAQRAVACIERLLCDDAVAFSPANLTQMVRLAHSELLHHQDSRRVEARMHCTIVVLWINAVAGHALWTHVGDSRLYRVRHGRVDVMSVDDSVVQRMVQAGLLTPAQSRLHPQKNQLLSALGIDGEIEPHTVVRPVELCEGDAFLLCTDGWWEAFDSTALVASLEQSATPAAWLADMRDRIQARHAPRQDNFSAIAVWAGDPGGVTIPGADDTQPRAQVRG
jgi:serine/threonine protein phosphatase PrpC